MKQGGAGFSTVEVIIGAALATIVGLAMNSLLLNISKGQKATQNSADFDSLKNSISQILSKNTLCKTSFHNQAGNGPAIFKDVLSEQERSHYTLKMGDSLVAQPGQKMGGGLEISTVMLKPVGGVAPDTTTRPGNTIYQVEMIVEAKKSSGSFGGPLLTNKSNPFRFAVVTNAANEVIDCSESTGGGDPDDESPESFCTGDGSYMYGIGPHGRPLCRGLSANCAAGKYLSGLSNGDPICEDLPGTPPPVVTPTYLSCASHDYAYNSCAGTGEPITSVTLTRQVSDSACRKGISFGITPNGKAMYVKSGCRGKFEIRY